MDDHLPNVPGGVVAMPVQAARFANLCALIEALEKAGVTQREAQAALLGNATTGFKLQSMLDGTPIPALFAERVEHALCRPRGWLSELHFEEADQLYPFESLVGGSTDCLCKRGVEQAGLKGYGQNEEGIAGKAIEPIPTASASA